MVVGGLPEKNTIHAECVANQALDMMLYCKSVVRPDNNEPIMVSYQSASSPLEWSPLLWSPRALRCTQWGMLLSPPRCV